MARLTLVHEGTVIREYELTKERMTVGRKPSNDIPLDDPTVSGQHAVILNLQNVYVEDLGSTNGTLINGKRINKRMLKHGDIVRIGHHEFKFTDDTAAEFEATMVLSAETMAEARQARGKEPAAATAGARPAPAAAKPAAAMVKVVSGPKVGQSIPLNKPYTTLGSPGVQVAVIARRGSSYYLMPMGGIGQQNNPPRLNDKVMGTQSTPLKEGDVIEVAGSKLAFTLNG
ncbi:MAG TPA: FHA domain-containing protein [Gammaproteobacteria bacterium]|nr:FHA domain-containing protein [Gammaproteobacteria bacterium]